MSGPIIRGAHAFLLLAACLGARAQPTVMNEAAAKEAVHRIVRHSGLLPNFVVREEKHVKTAVAYIKERERVIAYNTAFISSILDSTCTDQSAVSILAHEIAHHLLGHTLDPDAIRPGDELACDRYSGFILQRMGVGLDDALASMQQAGNVHGTERHPPQHARLAAIAQGWEEADRLDKGMPDPPFTITRDFKFVVRMVGDDNTYYVDARDRLVWFDNHAEPIEFGSCTRREKGEIAYELSWQDQHFVVDSRSSIWRKAPHGMLLHVGRMEPFGR